MSIDGEMFSQVSLAMLARRGRLAPRKLLHARPLIKPEVLCIDCRNIIGAFVANEPHVALLSYVDPLAQIDLEHYGCRVCSTRLVREKKSYAFGTRWRLI